MKMHIAAPPHVKCMQQTPKAFLRRIESTRPDVQVTCDEADDDRDWRLVLELLQKLGRKHVMGIAVGNELELLQYKKGISQDR